MISKKKKKIGLHRNSKVFFGRNQKFKGFFRPITGDLKEKKKVFTEIQRVFPAEIRNSRVFSGRMQVISNNKKRSSPKFKGFFRPKSEIQRFFLFFWPKSVDLQKKKKKKKKVFTDFG